jgi:hypothetical protein
VGGRPVRHGMPGDKSMHSKTLFGVLSVAANVIGYVPYGRDIVKGRTTPHVFTWLVWFLLAAIGFSVQVSNGAGAGSWVMGFTALATLAIFVAALKNGRKNVAPSDWVSLALAGLALLLWLFAKKPLLAIVLTTTVDVVGGFVPTFRKSYMRPREETVSLYVMYAVAWVFSLLALEKVDLTNALAPIVFITVNVALVAFLLVRRGQVMHSPRRSRS